MWKIALTKVGSLPIHIKHKCGTWLVHVRGHHSCPINGVCLSCNNITKYSHHGGWTQRRHFEVGSVVGGKNLENNEMTLKHLLYLCYICSDATNHSASIAPLRVFAYHPRLGHQLVIMQQKLPIQAVLKLGSQSLKKTIDFWPSWYVGGIPFFPLPSVKYGIIPWLDSATNCGIIN